MSFKDIFTWSSGSICAILVEGIMKDKIPWNYFEFGPVGQGMSFKRFLSGALAALLFGGAEPFMQFSKEGIIGNIRVKLFEIWTNGSGDVV